MVYEMHRNRIQLKRKSETNRCDFMPAKMEFQIINFARIECISSDFGVLSLLVRQLYDYAHSFI